MRYIYHLVIHSYYSNITLSHFSTRATVGVAVFYAGIKHLSLQTKPSCFWVSPQYRKGKLCLAGLLHHVV